MPGAARAGVGILIAGGIVVGVGTYYDKGSVSLYGLGMVVAGFALYMAASIMVRKRVRT